MKDNIFYLVFFVIILVLARIIPHPPNFTPIISFSILGPMILKNRLYGSAIPLIAMFISDIIIGFHVYQFVIYTVLLSISLISSMHRYFFYVFTTAILASIWFFISTNFAVWVILDYYPKTFDGLVICYTLAIPFFKNTLVSTLLFTGLAYLFLNQMENLSAKINNWFISIFNSIFKTKFFIANKYSCLFSGQLE